MDLFKENGAKEFGADRNAPPTVELPHDTKKRPYTAPSLSRLNVNESTAAGSGPGAVDGGIYS